MKHSENLKPTQEILRKKKITNIFNIFKKYGFTDYDSELSSKTFYTTDSDNKQHLSVIELNHTAILLHLNHRSTEVRELQHLFLQSLEELGLIQGARDDSQPCPVYRVTALHYNALQKLEMLHFSTDALQPATRNLLLHTLMHVCLLHTPKAFDTATSSRRQHTDLRSAWYLASSPEFQTISKKIEGAFVAHALVYELKARTIQEREEKKILIKKANVFQMMKAALNRLTATSNPDDYATVLKAIQNVCPTNQALNELSIYDGLHQSYTRPYCHIRSKTFWRIKNEVKDCQPNCDVDVADIFLSLLQERGDIYLNYRPAVKLSCTDIYEDLTSLMMPMLPKGDVYMDPITSSKVKQVILTVLNKTHMTDPIYLQKVYQQARKMVLIESMRPEAIAEVLFFPMPAKPWVELDPSALESSDDEKSIWESIDLSTSTDASILTLSSSTNSEEEASYSETSQTSPTQKR